MPTVPLDRVRAETADNIFFSLHTEQFSEDTLHMRHNDTDTIVALDDQRAILSDFEDDELLEHLCDCLDSDDASLPDELTTSMVVNHARSRGYTIRFDGHTTVIIDRETETVVKTIPKPGDGDSV